MESISALAIKGTLPPKVTRTRWLAHLDRGITSLNKTFLAYEAHLSSLSHSNPKAKGLYKMMMDKSLVCFTLSMKEIIDPLMRLFSLPSEGELDTSRELHRSFIMPEVARSLQEKVVQVKESGIYQGVVLRGNCPNMSYVSTLIDGLASAIQCRFQDTNEGVLNATKILDFSNWPDQSSEEFKDFCVGEITNVSDHFAKTLHWAIPSFDEDDAVQQCNWFKTEISTKFAKAKGGVKSATWKAAYDDSSDSAMVMCIINLLMTLPPTSVACETCFSQMKLVKTSRRTRLQQKTLNNLLVVRPASPSMQDVNPNPAIDHYMTSSVGRRQLTYKRQKKANAVEVVEIDEEKEEEEEEEEEETDLLEDEISDMFGETDSEDKIADFQSVEENLRNIEFLCRDI